MEKDSEFQTSKCDQVKAPMAASNSEPEMKKEEPEETMEEQPPHLHNHNQPEVNQNDNDDDSFHPLSAHSSPPHSLSGSKDPSPPLHSPSNSSDFSDHTCHTHGHSSIDDALSITPLEDFPPQANPLSPRPPAANRAQPTEPIVVKKVDAEVRGVRKVEEGSDSDGDVESGDGGAVGRGRKLMANLSVKKLKREELRKKILLGFRISGFAFCLISFSVMASDKNQGWALDSFYRYKEFRFVERDRFFLLKFRLGLDKLNWMYFDSSIVHTFSVTVRKYSIGIFIEFVGTVWQ